MLSGEMPEGCVENPYHKIAVTMLACFCTDQQLVRYKCTACNKMFRVQTVVWYAMKEEDVHTKFLFLDKSHTCN